MNSVFISAIIVLSIIFFAALITLILILRKKICPSMNLITKHYNNQNNQNAVLVDNMETCFDDEDLSSLQFNEQQDAIYKNSNWTSNVVDVLPHCLSILRISQSLTENVIKILMQEKVDEDKVRVLVNIGHKISGHVDEVVKSMYPPLDPRLLEARCGCLVDWLVKFLAAAYCIHPLPTSFYSPNIIQLNSHLKLIKEVGEAYEKKMKGEETYGPPNPHPPQKKLNPLKEEKEEDSEKLPSKIKAAPLKY